MIREEFYSEEDLSEETDDGDEVKLLKPSTPSSGISSAFEKYRKSSETIFDARCGNNSDDVIENDTRFVVNAINESHESLRKLVSE